MKDLIQIIDRITKYGLTTELVIENKEQDLEQSLVELYSFALNIDYKIDERTYADFAKTQFPDVIDNIQNNFPDFGYYHSILNSSEVHNEAKIATGDAVDDLSDIIYDILQIKWRIENNSYDDGLWYFQLIFNGHTQQHLIDLLKYIQSKNEIQ